jgi:BlaI family transcriptional regulator, penicillinase repressor
MPDRPDLSPGEFEIMDVLWRRGHASVREVQEALAPAKMLSKSAIATVLGRMKDKGYVDAREKNFAWEFRPLAKREQVVRRKLDDMVDRMFGGDVAPLAAYIADSRNLTPEQIRLLEEIAKSAPRREEE